MMILEHISAWLIASGARPIDLLFIAILFAVRRNDIKAIKALRAKYELLNTGLANVGWIIRLTLGVKAFKQHRNGDFEVLKAIDGIDTPVVFEFNEVSDDSNN